MAPHAPGAVKLHNEQQRKGRTSRVISTAHFTTGSHSGNTHTCGRCQHPQQPLQQAQRGGRGDAVAQCRRRQAVSRGRHVSDSSGCCCVLLRRGRCAAGRLQRKAHLLADWPVQQPAHQRATAPNISLQITDAQCQNFMLSCLRYLAMALGRQHAMNSDFCAEASTPLLLAMLLTWSADLRGPAGYLRALQPRTAPAASPPRSAAVQPPPAPPHRCRPATQVTHQLQSMRTSEVPAASNIKPAANNALSCQYLC